MGFGIALIGYAFLMLKVIGGALFGAPILAYGFFLASRLEKYFLNAAISALFMMPQGFLQFFALITGNEPNPTLELAFRTLYAGAWIITSFFWLIAVAKIAKENSATKLEFQARNRLIFTVIMITAAFAIELAVFFGIDGIQYIAPFKELIDYIVIFVNLLFLHTCFIMITSEAQYEKDKQQIATERAKAMEKRHKEQAEVKKRIEERKKK